MMLRLNKFLARAGHGSRRSVESLVTGGRVSVNGVIVTELGTQIEPATDTVEVDGVIASLPIGFRVYAFNKPRGVVCTLKSQKGQLCLASYRDDAALPARLMPVGRLDADSSGLLLWTDDGDLAQTLCRPNSEVWKVYDVLLDRVPTAAEQQAITGGEIRLDGRPCLDARLEAGESPRRWRLQLHEGRNRQIRRMFARLGINVRRLCRVQVGPIHLRRLHEGDFRRLDAREIESLRKASTKVDG